MAALMLVTHGVELVPIRFIRLDRTLVCQSCVDKMCMKYPSHTFIIKHSNNQDIDDTREVYFRNAECGFPFTSQHLFINSIPTGFKAAAGGNNHCEHHKCVTFTFTTIKSFCRIAAHEAC